MTENNESNDTNVEEKISTPETSSAPMPMTSGGGSGRKLLLLGIFLLISGLFAYDQLVAKNQFAKTQELMENMRTLKSVDGASSVDSRGKSIKQGDQDGDGFITPDDVRKVADREPSETTKLTEERYYETYSWPRVIPGRSYNLYVIYQKKDERDEMYRVMDKEPTKESVPDQTTVGAPGSVPDPSIGGGGSNQQYEDYKAEKKKREQEEAAKKEQDGSGSDSDEGSDDGEEEEEEEGNDVEGSGENG